MFPLYFVIVFLLVILITPGNKLNLIKNLSFTCSSLIFIYYLVILLLFWNFNFEFLFLYTNNFNLIFNIQLIFGIDNIIIYFLLLISLLITICLLLSWNNIYYNFKFYSILLLSLCLFLILTFMSLNLFLFYLFFECTLIPMFFLIGIWGSRQRKIHAVYQFFFYTVFGSVFLLAGIFYLYSLTYTFDIRLISEIKLSFDSQVILWTLFFIGFCVKMPMVPFHIWLPEAHVEAPTAGSVLLAGILLKIGSYGLLRFVVPIFPEASIFFSPIVFLFALISIIYISCIAIRQADLKKIIAYSSIAHMNFVLIGLFSFSINGLAGSIYLMLSHGIVSSALFICISVIYDRYHTRLINYYGNLVSVMPIYSTLFFFFTLANISFPGTSNFVGELLVLLGIFETNIFVCFIASFSILLTAIYSIWLINRILFGQFKTKFFLFSDLNKREFYILFSLLFLTLLFGFFPNLVLNKIEFWIFEKYIIL